MDPFERDTSPNLSMRQKSALKRRITREHNSNFRAGYININEQYLHKTGIRGRKRYFLYCLVVILLIVASVNVLLTTAVIYFMRLSPQNGMEWIEFIPDNDLLRFLGKSVFDTVQIYNGRIGSRANKDLYIEGNNSPVVMTDAESAGKNPSFSVGPDVTSVVDVEKFSFHSSQTGKEMFSTKADDILQLDGDITNLISPEIEVNNITSKQDIPFLILESMRSHMVLGGSEGLELVSTQENIKFYSKSDDIQVKSMGGSIVLDGARGVRFDMEHFPIITNVSQSGSLTYKLCVCLPQGRIFAIPVTGPGIGCQNADINNDPCK